MQISLAVVLFVQIDIKLIHEKASFYFVQNLFFQEEEIQKLNVSLLVMFGFFLNETLVATQEWEELLTIQ